MQLRLYLQSITITIENTIAFASRLYLQSTAFLTANTIELTLAFTNHNCLVPAADAIRKCERECDCVYNRELAIRECEREYNRDCICNRLHSRSQIQSHSRRDCICNRLHSRLQNTIALALTFTNHNCLAPAADAIRECERNCECIYNRAQLYL